MKLSEIGTIITIIAGAIVIHEWYLKKKKKNETG